MTFRLHVVGKVIDLYLNKTVETFVEKIENSKDVRKPWETCFNKTFDVFTGSTKHEGHSDRYVFTIDFLDMSSTDRVDYLNEIYIRRKNASKQKDGLLPTPPLPSKPPMSSKPGSAF